jgi:hypothetical protein
LTIGSKFDNQFLLPYDLIMFEFDFKIGDRVRIYNNGRMEDGVITKTYVQEDTVLLSKFKCYYVLLNNKTTLVDVYESRLLRDYTKRCECGADKLNHPGHDHYCPKFMK